MVEIQNTSNSIQKIKEKNSQDGGKGRTQDNKQLSSLEQEGKEIQKECI